MASRSVTAPLIPAEYDPQLFCVIENVQSNGFAASAAISGARPSKSPSKSSNKKGSKSKSSKKRKRKKSASTESRSNSNSNSNPKPSKKRKTSSSNSSSKNKMERIPKFGSDAANDLEMEMEMEMAEEEFEDETSEVLRMARYKTRPKRNCKTVSYSESVSVAVTEQKTQSVASEMSKVEMRWVQCDLCLKWRRIPSSISEGELTGEWHCSMNKWDLQRNHCAAPEEHYGDEQTLEVKNGAESSTVCEKRREFYDRLETFYASDAMAAKQLSVGALREQSIGGKPIDFLQLYLEITKRGGYHYCIAGRLWDEVFACLQCYTLSAVTAKDTLKELYRRFLSDYEQTYFVPPKEASNQPFVH